MKLLPYFLSAMIGFSSVAFSAEDESTLDQLKAALEKAGDKIEEMTKALEEYDWKGAYQDATSFGPISLSDTTINGHSRAKVVAPGEKLSCETTVWVNKDKMKDLKLQRILVGIKDLGPQTSFGIPSDKEKKETFTLTAPTEPGLYQIRFRPVVGSNDQWLDAEGKQPNFTYTIGVIWVKKPEAQKAS